MCVCVWGGGGGGGHHYIGLFWGPFYVFNVNYSIAIFLGMLSFLISLWVCLIFLG